MAIVRKIGEYIIVFGGLGYFLMKLTARDPEVLRKNLPERNDRNYSDSAETRNTSLLAAIKASAAGEDPAEAAKKAKKKLEAQRARQEEEKKILEEARKKKKSETEQS